MESIPGIKNELNRPVEAAFWKAVVLSGLVMLCALALGYVLTLGVAHSLTVTSLIPFSAVLLVFLAVSTIAGLAIAELKLLIPLGLASAVGVGLAFIPSMNAIIAGGIGLMALFFVGAYIEGRREVNQSLSPRFFKVAKTIMYRMILGIAIVIATVFFSAFTINDVRPDNPVLSQDIFEKGLISFSKNVRAVMGDIDFSKSLRDISQEEVSQLVDSGALPPSPALIDQTRKTLISGFQERLKTLTGTTIDPDQRISAAFYEAFLERFNGTEGPVRNIILAGMAFVLFLSVAAVSPFIRIIASVIAFVLYRFLLAVKFLGISFEIKSKEVVTLP